MPRILCQWMLILEALIDHDATALRTGVQARRLPERALDKGEVRAAHERRMRSGHRVERAVAQAHGVPIDIRLIPEPFQQLYGRLARLRRPLPLASCRPVEL